VAALVIAMGNTLRCDDGVAWQIVEALRNQIRDLAVEIVAVHQLTPELADLIRQAETVIFVDAACDLPPGQIRLESVAPSTVAQTGLSHSITPPMLLAVVRDLYGTVPERGLLLTVGGASFELSEKLSPPVARAIPAAIEKIQVLLKTKTYTLPKGRETRDDSRGGG
jgi:hydrogenase maturation protease